MGFDVRQVRKDFPVLDRIVRGKPLIYLDNAATSQKPRQVLEVLDEYYRTFNANIHRGIYQMSEEATARYEAVRGKVARFIGAEDPNSIVFTRNATEAINLVAVGWARKFLKEGDEVLLTLMEHHSDLVPWLVLSLQKGVKLQYLGLTPEGRLDLANLDQVLTRRTKLVCVTHMSNVLGAINPVADLARKAHAVGAKILVDSAQGVPHIPTNVQTIDCDFLAFSAHKMLGPMGVGVLYGRKEILESMDPLITGGEMIREVHLDRVTWNDVPWKFEAGTPSVGDVIAFGAALDYLNILGMDAVRAHEEGLTRRALGALQAMGDVILYGPKGSADRGGVVSFNLKQIHAHDVGQILDDDGIAVRAGHHCAQPLMRHLNVPATTRASFYVYNTEAEVDALVKSLARVKEVLFGVPRR